MQPEEPLHAALEVAAARRHPLHLEVPLQQARSLEPDKASIREALGRAYFRSGRYADAREEFAAVVERSPVNDFAHFCLGRSFEKLGDRSNAKRHLSLACGMRPDRKDYRIYRDRVRDSE